MKHWSIPTAAFLALTLCAQGAMPLAKKASLTSPFGAAPLNEEQLKALNEVLAVSEPGPAPKAAPAPAPAPSRPGTKPTKLKPSKKTDPAPSTSTTERRVEIVDAEDKTLSLTIDAKAGTITNLKTPPAQAAKVKALIAALNLGKGS